MVYLLVYSNPKSEIEVRQIPRKPWWRHYVLADGYTDHQDWGLKHEKSYEINGWLEEGSPPYLKWVPSFHSCFTSQKNDLLELKAILFWVVSVIVLVFNPALSRWWIGWWSKQRHTNPPGINRGLLDSSSFYSWFYQLKPPLSSDPSLSQPRGWWPEAKFHEFFFSTWSITSSHD